MSFRKRRNESDEESDEDCDLPIRRDDEDPSDGPSNAKKSRNLWSDMLVEEQLLKEGKKLELDKPHTKKKTTIHRGPESYVMPKDERNAKKQADAEAAECRHETPASDDPFGDTPDAPSENFGVKKADEKARRSHDGWWTKPGHARNFGGRGGGHHHPHNKWHPTKTSALLAPEYSLESLLSAEFMEGLPLAQLGEQMARVLGEKEPATISKIVEAIGEANARKLFEKTRETEKNGGMMTKDGSRRRTPGGVMILYFREDPDVADDVKDAIFGDMRNNVKEHRKQSRKRAHDFNTKLEDMKRVMEGAAAVEKKADGSEKIEDGEDVERKTKEEMETN
ncbi:unnamed protein product [Caenorhabditis bovis]|uniref:Phosphorylated adapter RNA export protein n=1 Tax=Caenorhabditis bovis TaxID=2654633 RepID=A0A8S1EKW7_9PELO|nr:unnamed protein product [Caenorhabditis bovis]